MLEQIVEEMAFWFDEIKKRYLEKETEVEQHLSSLRVRIIASEDSLEGNCFYYHNSCDIYEALIPKQLNLLWCGLTAKKRICEIGFNAGHSALLFFLLRDTEPIDFTVFDIGRWAYTRPCMDYINEIYPNIRIEYLEGDSLIEVPKWVEKNQALLGAYDLVHVDGGHSEECIKSDMLYADKLVCIGGNIIVDDSDDSNIKKCIESYLISGRYTELSILKTENIQYPNGQVHKGYPHRVIQKQF